MNFPKIINTYCFGSYVYGTFREGISDHDMIYIVSEPYVSADINKHYYTIEQFQSYIDNHDIQALECYFLPLNLKTESYKFDFKLSLSKLRTSISTITSNSWVKGKKKLTILGDYDKYAGIKSIFHSLRILEFGIQIVYHGRIKNYSEMNYVYFDLIKMSENLDGIQLWEAIDTKYRKLFNSKSTRFKELCPKDLTNVHLKDKVRTLMKDYNIENKDFYNELLTILNI